VVKGRGEGLEIAEPGDSRTCLGGLAAFQRPEPGRQWWPRCGTRAGQVKVQGVASVISAAELLCTCSRRQEQEHNGDSRGGGWWWWLWTISWSAGLGWGYGLSLVPAADRDVPVLAAL
jgi:hypothetical protein